jgi:hypothetical protein
VADILGNSEATLRLHYDGRTGIEKRKAVVPYRRPMTGHSTGRVLRDMFA